MNAIIRLGTGRLDRALRFGECGTCKYVVMLLHWFIYSDIDIQSPAKIEDREEFTHITETCVVSILGAIEVLAAGCKVYIIIILYYFLFYFSLYSQIEKDLDKWELVLMF